jgi:hypothetical protein
MVPHTVDPLGASIHSHGLENRALAKDVRAFGDEVRKLLPAFRSAIRDYEEASEEYARLKAEYAFQLVELRKVEATFREAARRWRAAQLLIVAAAAIDAANLDSQRAPKADGNMVSCDMSMSADQYRELLLAQGISLYGMHVDHIVPLALGGANHPSNYQIISAHDNLSYGARFDVLKCDEAGREFCRKAVDVSRRCGTFRGRVSTA